MVVTGAAKIIRKLHIQKRCFFYILYHYGKQSYEALVIIQLRRNNFFWLQAGTANRQNVCKPF